MSPTVTDTDDDIPTVVAIPTDCLGLKYTTSSTLESNAVDLKGISKKLGVKLNLVDTV